MKDIIKKYDLDILLFIICLTIGPVFIKNIYVDDELWNFAYIYKINLGFLPYKDLNIIVTPLFHLLGMLIMKIVGFNYFGFHIYNLLIAVTSLFLIVKILKSLNTNRKHNILILMLTFMLYRSLIGGGANYNLLAYIPILISLLLLIKNIKNYYIHGFLIFLTFLIKQNIGIYFGIGISIYIILDKKNIIKNLLKLVIINSAGLAIFIIILLKLNILYDFYYFAFSGIKSFALNNINITENILFLVIFIPLNILIVCIVLKYKVKKKNIIIENIKKIYSIGIPLVLTAFPIFNLYHILLSILIIWIGFMYVIEQTFIIEIFNENQSKIMLIILVLFIIAQLMIKYINITNEYYFVNDCTSIYYGSWFNNEIEEHIKKIDEFIKENNKENINVIILSSSYNLYKLPLKQNDGAIYNVLLNGNFGKDGEDGVINNIKQMEKTKILIQTNETDMFWQESKKIRKYIQENLKKIGTIENFDIYYKK